MRIISAVMGVIAVAILARGYYLYCREVAASLLDSTLRESDDRREGGGHRDRLEEHTGEPTAEHRVYRHDPGPRKTSRRGGGAV